jgi:hypothetical protein
MIAKFAMIYYYHYQFIDFANQKFEFILITDLKWFDVRLFKQKREVMF